MRMRRNGRSVEGMPESQRSPRRRDAPAAPRMDGIEATRRIRAELPDVRVFGLSTQERSDGHPIERAGAAGYCPAINARPRRFLEKLIALQDRLGARVV